MHVWAKKKQHGSRRRSCWFLQRSQESKVEIKSHRIPNNCLSGPWPSVHQPMSHSSNKPPPRLAMPPNAPLHFIHFAVLPFYRWAASLRFAAVGEVSLSLSALGTYGYYIHRPDLHYTYIPLGNIVKIRKALCRGTTKQRIISLSGFTQNPGPEARVA